jgi:hypothetical protein
VVRLVRVGEQLLDREVWLAYQSYQLLLTFIDFTLDWSFASGYERMFIHWYWRFNRH